MKSSSEINSHESEGRWRAHIHGVLHSPRTRRHTSVAAVLLATCPRAFGSSSQLCAQANGTLAHFVMSSQGRQDDGLARALKDFISGGAAGIAQIISSHPLDTIKTRLQTQPKENPLFKGGVDCFVKTVKSEGFLGLYKGMSSPLAGIAFVNAVLFGAYGHMQAWIHPDKSTPLTLTETAICGAGAGFANSFVASPVEMIKVRLQIQYNAGSREFSGALDAARKIYQARGLGGIYRGLGATIYREIPAYATWYSSYELLKRQLIAPDATDVNPLNYLFAGAIAGVGYWTVCYPIDVAKSTIQTSDTYNSTLQALRGIYRTNGLSGLYAGYLPAVARAVPAAGATLVTYELVRKWL